MGISRVAGSHWGMVASCGKTLTWGYVFKQMILKGRTKQSHQHPPITSIPAFCSKQLANAPRTHKQAMQSIKQFPLDPSIQNPYTAGSIKLAWLTAITEWSSINFLKGLFQVIQANNHHQIRSWEKNYFAATSPPPPPTPSIFFSKTAKSWGSNQAKRDNSNELSSKLAWLLSRCLFIKQPDGPTDSNSKHPQSEGQCHCPAGVFTWARKKGRMMGAYEHFWPDWSYGSSNNYMVLSGKLVAGWSRHVSEIRDVKKNQYVPSVSSNLQ